MPDDTTPETSNDAPKGAMTDALQRDQRNSIWMSCYSAALTGLLVGNSQAAENSKRIARMCCELADAALAAIESRQPPSGTQNQRL